MKPLVKVLYEDEQAADAKNFGLHTLVCRCVHDRLGWPEERWNELTGLIVGHPKKGYTKLLAACQDVREGSGAHHLVAVFDDDKIRKLQQLGLPPRACKLEVRQAIEAHSPLAAQLRVVLLQRNMETVVEAVQRSRSLPVTGKLRPLDRDSLLLSIVWRPDFAPARRCVLADVPSLAYLVDKLADLVSRRTSP